MSVIYEPKIKQSHFLLKSTVLTIKLQQTWQEAQSFYKITASLRRFIDLRLHSYKIAINFSSSLATGHKCRIENKYFFARINV